MDNFSLQTEIANYRTHNLKSVSLFQRVLDRSICICLQIIHYEPQSATFPYDTIMPYVNFQCFSSGVYLQAESLKLLLKARELSWGRGGSSPTVSRNRA
jgi:hypothetical protein